MGHKVNPEIFRLGISVDWKYQLKDPLLANIFIYRTVKKLFTAYSAPYVSYAIRRNVNPRIITSKKRKDKMIDNYFFKNSLIFSHLNISYAPSLHIGIFFLDGEAEHRRITEDQRENAFYYLSGKFFPVYSRSYRYFLKNIYTVKKSDLPIYAMKWYHYDELYLKCLPEDAEELFIPKDIIRMREYYRKRAVKYLPHFKFIILRRSVIRRARLRLISGWLISNSYLFPNNYYVKSFISSLRVLRFLLRYFALRKTLHSKIKVFYFNILFRSLTAFLFLANNLQKSMGKSFRRMTVFGRIVYLQHVLFLQLVQQKYSYLRYNKKIFEDKLPMYRYLPVS